MEEIGYDFLDLESFMYPVCTESVMGLFCKLLSKSPKDKFASDLVVAIQRAGETTSIRYDASEFRLLTKADAGRVFNLGNVYSEYCSVPASNRTAFIQKLVKVWFSDRKEVPDEFDDVHPDLLAYVEFARVRDDLEGLTFGRLEKAE